MPKPHRVLIDRVSGYADEAGAFIRRRRHNRRPFARLYWSGGRSAEPGPETESGAELFAAAGELSEVAGKRPRG